MKNLFNNMSWGKFLIAVVIIGIVGQAAFGADTDPRVRVQEAMKEKAEAKAAEKAAKDAVAKEAATPEGKARLEAAEKIAKAIEAAENKKVVANEGKTAKAVAVVLGEEMKIAQTATERLEVLIPVYQGEGRIDANIGLVGEVLVDDMGQASRKAAPSAAMQASAARGEAFVKNVLGHEGRISDYGVAQATAAMAGDAKLTEAIVQDRLEDEATLERLENPGWMTRLKWWWNS